MQLQFVLKGPSQERQDKGEVRSQSWWWEESSRFRGGVTEKWNEYALVSIEER